MNRQLAFKELQRLIEEGRSILTAPDQVCTVNETHQWYTRWTLRCRNLLHVIGYPTAPWNDQFPLSQDEDILPRVKDQVALMNVIAGAIHDEVESKRKHDSGSR